MAYSYSYSQVVGTVITLTCEAIPEHQEHWPQVELYKSEQDSSCKTLPVQRKN